MDILDCLGNFKLSSSPMKLTDPNTTISIKETNENNPTLTSSLTSNQEVKNFIWIFAIFQANNENNDGDMNTSNSMNTITNTGNTVEVNNNRRRRRSPNHLLKVIR